MAIHEVLVEGYDHMYRVCRLREITVVWDYEDNYYYEDLGQDLGPNEKRVPKWVAY